MALRYARLLNPPFKVLSADKITAGRATGGWRQCQMEGCSGKRIGVRWPDGQLTWPCTKGMDISGDVWQIL